MVANKRRLSKDVLNMIYNLKLSVSSLNYLGWCACIAKSRACRPEAPDFDTPVWYSTRCTCNAPEFWIFFTENKSSAGIRKRLDIAKKTATMARTHPKDKKKQPSPPKPPKVSHSSEEDSDSSDTYSDSDRSGADAKAERKRKRLERGKSTTTTW